MERLFKCSFCGLISDSISKVTACEDSHLKTDKVKVVVVSGYDLQGKIPKVATVLFEDGTKVDYMRIGGDE